jgi:hypothetical protein
MTPLYILIYSVLVKQTIHRVPDGVYVSIRLHKFTFFCIFLQQLLGLPKLSTPATPRLVAPTQSAWSAVAPAPASVFLGTSACRLVGIGTPPEASSPPPPGTKRGRGHHNWPAGVGEFQFRRLEKKLSALCLLCVWTKFLNFFPRLYLNSVGPTNAIGS